jgi:hypothetical protein
MPKHLCQCWCGNFFNSILPTANDCGGPHAKDRREKPEEQPTDDDE